ncbi:MAG: hypothetical protein F7C35_08690 [Desulfurococcales archaeon]|nr:hypothetical protein [Desulfurococcales archaeon]
MPLACIVGGGEWSACLEHFLLYLGFEVRRGCGGGERPDVLILIECTDISGIVEGARVIAMPAHVAVECGGDYREAVPPVESPTPLRVLKDRGLLVWRGNSYYLVFRELERLLGWKGLIWYTPPLSRERVLSLMGGGRGRSS